MFPQHLLQPGILFWVIFIINTPFYALLVKQVLLFIVADEETEAQESQLSFQRHQINKWASSPGYLAGIPSTWILCDLPDLILQQPRRDPCHITEGILAWLGAAQWGLASQAQAS